MFTGGTEIGRKVYEGAAPHLTPVTLELGGKSPVIVAADADIDVAAKRIAWTKLINSGQICIAPDYVLADAKIRDELVDKIKDAVTKFESDDSGGKRIVNQRHFDRLTASLAATKGTVAIGGGSDASTLSIQPTVVVDPDPAEPLMTDEIFGPILPVMTVQSLDDAINFVNSRPKPLAAYLFTKTKSIRERVIKEVSAGGMVVNHLLFHFATNKLPFGGVGPSGMGAYHGKFGFEEFSHRKAVMTKPTRPDVGAFIYPPYTEKAWKLARKLIWIAAVLYERNLMPGVQDRVIVVTGAGGGLGREYALTLAREGASVVVNDLGGSRDGTGAGHSMADEVVKEIKDAGGRAVANYDSVAESEGAENIIKTALDEFGKVDGVVSNAGILRDGTFHKMEFANWDAVLKVHLYGGYNVIRAAWPHFREQSFGRVVVATSTSGLFGNFGQANYGAAKLGLVGLINTLAQEGAKYNIKANAVAPIAATRMTQDILPPEVFEKLTPEYVAPVVAYLCTEEVPDTASVFIVGGGKVQRTALFQNEGVTFSGVPSVDDVASKWGEIADLSAAQRATFSLG